MDGSQIPDFSIGEVFSDAFGAFRARIGTYGAFNAIWLVGLFLFTCVFMGCILFLALGVGGAAAAGNSGDNPMAMLGSMGVGVLFGYLFLILIMLAAFVVHHGFSIVVAVNELRGQAIDLATGISAVGGRLLGHIGLLIVKLGIDWVFGCVVFGVLGGAMAGMGSAMPRLGPDTNPTEVMGAMAGFIGLFFLAYVVWLVWVIAMRGFVGLAAAALQMEGIGPIDAVSRSVSLLSGRRLQFIGMRILWAIMWFFGILLLYVPIVALAAIFQSDGQPNPLVSLITLPYSLFIYFVIYMTLSFDSALEAAFYARCAPTLAPTTHVAEVFG